MKLNHEHSLLPPVGEGPHIYISGDDDPDSPDLRLSFVTEHGTVWHDMTPKRMAQLRDLIVEALQDCDQCEHGITNGDWCIDCNLAVKQSWLENGE
jgi:hypothetical protein